jgi:hypothetical protein
MLAPARMPDLDSMSKFGDVKPGMLDKKGECEK